MNPAPGWDIVQGARIGASDFEALSGPHGFDAVLNADHRQWTQEVTRIEFFHGLNVPLRRNFTARNRADGQIFSKPVADHADFDLLGIPALAEARG